MEKFLQQLEKTMHESNYLLENMTKEQIDLIDKLNECLLIAQRIAYRNNVLDFDKITPKRYLEITLNETI
tara:strand:+ start:335 stop:544 length:210 start_codon:yes stop_codon:yes gene_type:complete